MSNPAHGTLEPVVTTTDQRPLRPAARTEPPGYRYKISPGCGCFDALSPRVIVQSRDEADRIDPGSASHDRDTSMAKNANVSETIRGQKIGPRSPFLHIYKNLLYIDLQHIKAGMLLSKCSLPHWSQSATHRCDAPCFVDQPVT